MGETVIVTRRLPDEVEERMQQLFDVRFNPSDRPFTQAELVSAVREARVLVPTITDRVDETVLSQAGETLGLIASFGNGVDHVNLEAATRRGIAVTNTPGVVTEDTADMAMALLLSVPRRVNEGVNIMASGRFTGWSPTWMLGRRVSGKRLGIIGMGRIGAAVAHRARAFGMSIHYHNRQPAAPSVAEPLDATYWKSLDQMLARMDFVSIHCPHTPATYHLLSARRLQLMRPESVLVNLARGEIVDEAALIDQLERGALGGAALDVFEHEPAVDPRLLALANQGKAILLPHMGSSTIEGRRDMGDTVIVNIRTFLDGHRPPNLVLPHLEGVHRGAAV